MDSTGDGEETCVRSRSRTRGRGRPKGALAVSVDSLIPLGSSPPSAGPSISPRIPPSKPSSPPKKPSSIPSVVVPPKLISPRSGSGISGGSGRPSGKVSPPPSRGVPPLSPRGVSSPPSFHPPPPPTVSPRSGSSISGGGGRSGRVSPPPSRGVAPSPRGVSSPPPSSSSRGGPLPSPRGVSPPPSARSSRGVFPSLSPSSPSFVRRAPPSPPAGVSSSSPSSVRRAPPPLRGAPPSPSSPSSVRRAPPSPPVGRKSSPPVGVGVSSSPSSVHRAPPSPPVGRKSSPPPLPPAHSDFSSPQVGGGSERVSTSPLPPPRSDSPSSLPPPRSVSPSPSERVSASCGSGGSGGGGGGGSGVAPLSPLPPGLGGLVGGSSPVTSPRKTSPPSLPPSSPRASPRVSSPRVSSPREWTKQTSGTFPTFPPVPLKDESLLKNMRKEHLKQQEESAKKQEAETLKMDKGHQAELGTKERQYQKELEGLKKDAEIQQAQMESVHSAEMKKLKKDFEEAEKKAQMEEKSALKMAAKERAEHVKESIRAAKTQVGKDKNLYKKMKSEIEGEAKMRQQQEEEKELNRVVVDSLIQRLAAEKGLLLKQLRELHFSTLQALYQIFTLIRVDQQQTQQRREAIMTEVHKFKGEIYATKEEVENQHLDKEIKFAKGLLSTQQAEEARALEKELEAHAKSENKEHGKCKKHQQKALDEEKKRIKKEKKDAPGKNEIDLKTPQFDLDLGKTKEAKTIEMEKRHTEETLATTEALAAVIEKMINDHNTKSTAFEQSKVQEWNGLNRQHQSEFGSLIEAQGKQLQQAWDVFTKNRRSLLDQLQAEALKKATQAYEERSALFVSHLVVLTEDLFCTVTDEDKEMAQKMKEACTPIIEQLGQSNTQEALDLIKTEEKESTSLAQLLKRDVGDPTFFDQKILNE